MKSKYLVFSCLLFQFHLAISGVPDAVREAFRKSFPNATEVKWTKESGSSYEAEFKMEGNEISALYSIEGTLKEIENEIKITDLPAAVVNGVKLATGGKKIREASRIYRTADKTTVYETEIRKGFKSKDLLFDESGNLIK